MNEELVFTPYDPLGEIELFFNIAMRLEENKFNLYPKESQEIQEKCINLVIQRLNEYD